VVATGIAIADAGSPPAAGYVSIAPAKILGASIGANKTISAVAIGGSTPAPTDATAVKLTVTIKDAQGGRMLIYPAGDPTAPGAASVPFAGGSTTTATVQETVGIKNGIAFQNASSSTATVTAALIGYSTQITASNIAADGGVSGQVLTNNGNGVAWKAGTVGVNAGTGLSGGGSVSLGGATTLGVANSGIGTAQLADGAVTTSKLADAGVTTSKLADGSVTTTKLVDGSVTSAKLATSANTLGYQRSTLDPITGQTSYMSPDPHQGGYDALDLPLPPGSYLITAKAQGYDAASSPVDLQCYLVDGSSWSGSYYATRWDSSGNPVLPGGYATEVVGVAQTFSAANTIVRLTCTTDPSTTPTAQAWIQAVKVDSLH
jgi:hypothetical protein